MPTAYDRWKLMTPEQDARHRGVFEEDEEEPEMVTEIAADEHPEIKRQRRIEAEYDFYSDTTEGKFDALLRIAREQGARVTALEARAEALAIRLQLVGEAVCEEGEPVLTLVSQPAA